MTHQIIEKIEQKMRAHLNVEQQNILHNALLQCLSEEIVQSGESGTENFVKIFLSSAFKTLPLPSHQREGVFYSLHARF